jgi:hypothetical protein
MASQRYQAHGTRHEHFSAARTRSENPPSCLERQIPALVTVSERSAANLCKFHTAVTIPFLRENPRAQACKETTTQAFTMTYDDVRIEASSEVRFSAYFSHFFEARFSTTISTEASIQIPLFLAVLGEKTIKQARGNPQNPHVLSTFTASRVSPRQTAL